MKTGVYSLGDIQITAAQTYTGDWVTGFDGITGLTYQLRFEYGSGGGDIRVFLQTSLDQGGTVRDIDCQVFGVSSSNPALSFDSRNTVQRSGSPPSGIEAADGALDDNTSIDGLLGDRFRIKVVSTGTYSGSTVLAPRIVTR